jgi:hypothetical protein
MNPRRDKPAQDAPDTSTAVASAGSDVGASRRTPVATAARSAWGVLPRLRPTSHRRGSVRGARQGNEACADAVATDGGHFEPDIAPGDGIADDGRSAELREYEAADGIDVIVNEHDAERFADLFDADGTVGTNAADPGDGEFGLFAGAFGDVADDFLEEVLERDDTGGAAVFVLLRMPTRRRSPLPIPLSVMTSGYTASWITRMTGATVIAVRAGSCSASALGTISAGCRSSWVRSTT